MSGSVENKFKSHVHRIFAFLVSGMRDAFRRWRNKQIVAAFMFSTMAEERFLLGCNYRRP